MINMKKFSKIAVLLALSLSLCSCNTKGDIPELIEPVGSEATFRPVKRENLGKTKIMLGSVVGTDYCHFYTKGITIKNIKVSIGDYVEKGDVLVEADLDDAKRQLAALQSELSELKRQHEIDHSLQELSMQRLELEAEWAEYGYGKDYAENLETNIELEKENNVYNDKMYDFQVDKINESMAELNKIINDGTLRAKCSGYVSYVKDLTDGLYAGINENIVIVTDMEDLFISANIDTRSYTYSKYPVKFAYINGKKYDIEEYKYTEAEEAFYKVQGMYPLQRFKTKEEVELNPGDYIVLQFYLDDKNDCLCVGKDAILTDEQGYFVYVKHDDGTLEKRYFEAGSVDSNYREVISGLEEGELVLYTQEAMPPKMDGEATAQLDKWSFASGTKGARFVESSTYSYYSEDKGEVAEVYVTDSTEVKKGDPLVKISINSDKATLVGIENQISSENRRHDDAVKDNDKSYKDLTKLHYELIEDKNTYNSILDDIKAKMSNPSTSDADLGKLALSKEQTERALTETIYKSLYNDLDLQILELEKQSEEYAHNSRISSLKTQYAQAEENNNGTGYKIIYAEYDGIVSGFPVDERTKVDVGKKLLETVTYFDDVIRVGAQGSVTEKTGYSYTITVKDDTYKADVICGNQYMLPHIFTEDGKVYGTTTKIDASNFYIRPEADFLKLSSQFLTLEASMDSLRLENMLIVPGEYVFKEKSFDDEIYHYVWVKDGDLVYKQYVITGLEDRIGEKIGDENKTIILSGLSVGDTIVK